MEPEAVADAHRWGLPPEQIAAIAAQLVAADDAGVWPENVHVVTAFLAVDTQWRVAAGGLGRPLWIGLDYGAARAGLDAAAIQLTPELWAGLQFMERAAAAALNEL